MILSLSPMTYQDGIVRHAGAPDFSLSPPNAAGRWDAATIALSLALRPFAKDSKTADFLRYRSVSGVGGSLAGRKSKIVVGSGTESAESGPARAVGVSPLSGAKALTYTNALTFET